VPRRVAQLVLPAGILVGLIVLRLFVVASWKAPAGDGVQYYKVAEELREHRRLAFAPPPSPLTYSRLPGYPLFMALVAPRPVSLAAHIRVATWWNVVLDVLSALLLGLSAHSLGFRRRWLGPLVFLSIPTLCLMTCYALSESLSTLAASAALYSAIRVKQTGKLRFAIALGIIAGCAQLIRFDAVCMLPLLVYGCLGSTASRSHKQL
jgi:hypothetical protein